MQGGYIILKGSKYVEEQDDERSEDIMFLYYHLCAVYNNKTPPDFVDFWSNYLLPIVSRATKAELNQMQEDNAGNIWESMVAASMGELSLFTEKKIRRATMSHWLMFAEVRTILGPSTTHLSTLCYPWLYMLQHGEKDIRVGTLEILHEGRQWDNVSTIFAFADTPKERRIIHPKIREAVWMFQVIPISVRLTLLSLDREWSRGAAPIKKVPLLLPIELNTFSSIVIAAKEGRSSILAVGTWESSLMFFDTSRKLGRGYEGTIEMDPGIIFDMKWNTMDTLLAVASGDYQCSIQILDPEVCAT
ncbi:uncharacterized protein EV420DRAFT_1472693 [Desarmillaria tabescens]|uniref:Uncharacterized protein n=1 Tax=Armillaria tabescens TaxID=1929756 RepID=A0AA39T7B3_ARMTA|nr:uncharacterized protein EV420DRAFT_1472693 [Desarmillaria tabescens]KAK0469466.1 hypothetical protein EV420DRAFT_1472693 [Desarmillaria tabescens]